MSSRPGAPPLSYIVQPSRLGGKELGIEIVATAEQCVAIQKGLDVEKLVALAGIITVAPGANGSVKICGRIRARLTRRCVVTLNNFECEINETFEELFRPQPEYPSDHTSPGTVDIDDPDDAETFADDEIDLGSLAVEILALALDPYPRGPGAPPDLTSLDQLGWQKLQAKNLTAGPADKARTRQSPFAGLAKRLPS